MTAISLFSGRSAWHSTWHGSGGHAIQSIGSVACNPIGGRENAGNFLDDQLPQPAVAGVALILRPPNQIDGVVGAGDRQSGRRQPSGCAIELEPWLRQ